MKKLLFVISLFAILFTQCKKSEQIVPVTPESKTVNITLDVSGNSKVDVWTQHGAVAFESGDVIYVASAGKYVGTLTHNGTKFEGSITDATEGQKLYFYFMGNKTPSETLNESTTSLTVNISDQTTEYPVISSAPSAQNFSSETSDYSAILLNKCALVKFDVTSYSSSDVWIRKMNNKVCVDLGTNVYTSSKVNNGTIKLPKGSGERWAILLPQPEITGNSEGDVISADSIFKGTFGTIPEIKNNSYINSGVTVTLTTGHEFVNLGLPSGLIWATCDIGAAFPEQLGDLYAWGCVDTQEVYDWSHYKWGWSYNHITKYFATGYDVILQPEDDAAHIKWGGNWRMPTRIEMNELISNCSHNWETVNGVTGMMFTGPNGNNIFFPAKETVSMGDVNYIANYWTSTLDDYYSYYAFHLYFTYLYYNPMTYDDGYRYEGLRIRPVRQP